MVKALFDHITNKHSQLVTNLFINYFTKKTTTPLIQVSLPRTRLLAEGQIWRAEASSSVLSQPDQSIENHTPLQFSNAHLQPFLFIRGSRGRGGGEGTGRNEGHVHTFKEQEQRGGAEKTRIPLKHRFCESQHCRHFTDCLQQTLQSLKIRN